MYFCLKLPSASSWGCELKYFSDCHLSLPPLSASSWGCELKYCLGIILCFDVRSASSWGCELKYHPDEMCRSNLSQPLREAVSWNSSSSSTTRRMESQPLREAVSWNAMCLEQMEEDGLSASSWGCELKCTPIHKYITSLLSASSWGCELKYGL